MTHLKGGSSIIRTTLLCCEKARLQIGKVKKKKHQQRKSKEENKQEKEEEEEEKCSSN